MHFEQIDSRLPVLPASLVAPPFDTIIDFLTDPVALVPLICVERYLLSILSSIGLAERISSFSANDIHFYLINILKLTFKIGLMFTLSINLMGLLK